MWKIFLSIIEQQTKTSFILCTCVIIWDKFPKYSRYRRVSAHLDSLTSSKFFRGLEKAFAVLDGSIVYPTSYNFQPYHFKPKNPLGRPPKSLSKTTLCFYKFWVTNFKLRFWTNGNVILKYVRIFCLQHTKKQ